ncbi:hypothetical protein BT63DRAFT_418556 [Microthyrium microscopicum]|uniref:Uncharacterized protein n=1 Tax=Microthyrium microscopicum TaxID=703497 RepID=A0A6A6TUY7_9PEZI|nr:hypothetical protein BT63DRAFT_418556 [Microthyrium microscopicum]
MCVHAYKYFSQCGCLIVKIGTKLIHQDDHVGLCQPMYDSFRGSVTQAWKRHPREHIQNKFNCDGIYIYEKELNWDQCDLFILSPGCLEHGEGVMLNRWNQRGVSIGRYQFTAAELALTYGGILKLIRDVPRLFPVGFWNPDLRAMHIPDEPALELIRLFEFIYNQKEDHIDYAKQLKLLEGNEVHASRLDHDMFVRRLKIRRRYGADWFS